MRTTDQRRITDKCELPTNASYRQFNQPRSRQFVNALQQYPTSDETHLIDLEDEQLMQTIQEQQNHTIPFCEKPNPHQQNKNQALKQSKKKEETKKASKTKNTKEHSFVRIQISFHLYFLFGDPIQCITSRKEQTYALPKFYRSPNLSSSIGISLPPSTKGQSKKNNNAPLALQK